MNLNVQHTETISLTIPDKKSLVKRELLNSCKNKTKKKGKREKIERCKTAGDRWVIETSRGGHFGEVAKEVQHIRSGTSSE